jgi:hypothetical protein
VHDFADRQVGENHRQVAENHHKKKEKGRPLHSMTRLLIGCMQTLFLKLAAIIFGLD